MSLLELLIAAIMVVLYFLGVKDYTFHTLNILLLQNTFLVTFSRIYPVLNLFATLASRTLGKIIKSSLFATKIFGTPNGGSLLPVISNIWEQTTLSNSADYCLDSPTNQNILMEKAIWRNCSAK